VLPELPRELPEEFPGLLREPPELPLELPRELPELPLELLREPPELLRELPELPRELLELPLELPERGCSELLEEPLSFFPSELWSCSFSASLPVMPAAAPVPMPRATEATATHSTLRSLVFMTLTSPNTRGLQGTRKWRAGNRPPPVDICLNRAH
jgi:hypothetical protein